jgi:hypothetical protein
VDSSVSNYKYASEADFSVDILNMSMFFNGFGEFVEIQFYKYGKISGVAVRTYLLERSRACKISDPAPSYPALKCYVLHHRT